jgi:hypothetical protein
MATTTQTMTATDWRNIALCASARAEHAVEDHHDWARADREGLTAALLYHGLYLNA